MSNKEIEKQAMELIVKHHSIISNSEWGDALAAGASSARKAIKAAIVSCEFALKRACEFSALVEGPYGVECSSQYEEIEQIKAYLEGLL